MEAEQLLIQRSSATNYVIRTEQYQGQPHIVVPVVMMVEGVHSGSRGPLLHTAAELGHIPASWDGIPIVINHPQRNGNYISANSPEVIERECVGRVHNTKMVGTKLMAEAWLNEAKLGTLSAVALQTIKDRKPINVSVGVFTDDEEVEGGSWNGEAYTAIAHNHRPDHLAILPNEDGACNWDDGCGIRANKSSNPKEKSSIFVNKKTGGFMKTKQQEVAELLVQRASEENATPLTAEEKGIVVASAAIIQNNETGFMEVTQKIQRLLDAMDNGNQSHYLDEVFPNSVVYRVNDNVSRTTKFYRRGITVASDSSVTLGDNPQEVNKKIEYINVNLKRTKMERTKSPACQQKVDALIANTATNFTEDNRDWLLAQDAETIELLTPKAAPAEVEVAANKKVEATAPKDVAPKVLTDAEYMAQMPQALREQMEAGLKVHAAQKTALIAGILTNTKDTWIEDELKAMNLETLSKIAKSAAVEEKAVVDYTGLGGNAARVQTPMEEVLLPLGVNAVETK